MDLAEAMADAAPTLEDSRPDEPCGTIGEFRARTMRSTRDLEIAIHSRCQKQWKTTTTISDPGNFEIQLGRNWKPNSAKAKFLLMGPSIARQLAREICVLWVTRLLASTARACPLNLLPHLQIFFKVAVS